jgi:hypothetical protein
MVDPEGHTPSFVEGMEAVWVSPIGLTHQRARPRSAVTVSLSVPALMRLTRSVRVRGRVDPDSGSGTGDIGNTASAHQGLAWALRLVVLYV